MKFHYTTTKTMLSREQSALKSWHTHTHTPSHTYSLAVTSLTTHADNSQHNVLDTPTNEDDKARTDTHWFQKGQVWMPVCKWSLQTHLGANRMNERTNARTKEENNSKQTQKLNESRRTTDGRRATQRTHSRREQEDTFSFGESHCIHSLVLLPLLVFLIQSSATATDVRPTLTQSRHIEMQLHIFIKM